MHKTMSGLGTTLALTTALFIAGCATQSPNPPITRLVVVGDSNVDNGNLLRQTRNEIPPAPNWKGRNSNGPSVVEYLAKMLDARLDDYAVSGATTGELNIIPKISPPHAYVEHSGVAVQVNQLIERKERLSQTDLVVLWAGSNDIFGAPRKDRAALDQRIGTAAANIEKAIVQLHGLGARRFLVANRTPRDVIGSDNDLNGVDLNNAVSVAVAQARQATKADIQLYDAYSAIADMVRQPQKYGFKEVKALCWDVPECVNDSLEKGLPIGSTYVNWDGAHKTTRVHQLMAEQINQMIRR